MCFLGDPELSSPQGRLTVTLQHRDAGLRGPLESAYRKHREGMESEAGQEKAQEWGDLFGEQASPL